MSYYDQSKINLAKTIFKRLSDFVDTSEKQNMYKQSIYNKI